MKKIMFVCIAVCFAVAIVSAAAFADDDPMGKCNFMSRGGNMGMCGKEGMGGIFMHKVHMILGNAEELALTDDQIEKVKTAKYSLEKNIIKQDADIKTLGLDIKQELGKDDISVDNINRLIDQKYALKAQKTKDEIAAYVSIKKILTPDQVKKLKEMHKAMKPRHMGMTDKKE